MIALPENAIEPSSASTSPGQTARTPGSADAFGSTASEGERIEAIVKACFESS
jgi:hypothetical protein